MLLKLFLVCLLVSFTVACKSNGACGCCGCRAKAKARGAVIKHLDGEEFKTEDDGNIFGLSIWNKTSSKIEKESFPLITNPNHLFHRCCEERGLPEPCVKHCHFNEYSGQLLQNIFVGTHECPVEFIPEMQFCAAQGFDHRDCCTSSGVGATPAGEKCLLFCDQTPDKFTPVDYSYTPCLERFEDMKRCFYDDIKERAQKRFQNIILSSRKSPRQRDEGKNNE